MSQVKVGFIYLITNTVNNKKYVGLTSSTVARRWSQHKYESKHNSQTYLYRAIRAHGVSNFVVSVLEKVPLQNLNEAEIKRISHFDSNNRNKGYNYSTGGNRPVMGPEFGAASRARQMGKSITEEHRKNIALGKLGTKNTPEFSLKMSLICRGRKLAPRSLEHSANLSAVWARKRSEKAASVAGQQTNPTT